MTESSEKTATFTAQDGTKIFYRYYPAENERARMVIAHGLGEHSGRYSNVIQTFHPHGISIWALDHRGHGQSGGPRGHISSFQEYIEDLNQLIQMAKKDIQPGMKTFLLGHSMGGLIALMFAAQYPEMLDGVIASSPGLGMRVKVPAFKEVMGKIMSSIWPGLSLGNELDSSKISRDKEVVRAYDQDPLVHGKVSARWFTEFLKAMDKANHLAGKLRVPLLMQVAGDDHLVDAHASKRFFDKMTSKDKTLRVYDGLYHEVYNELKPARARVLGDLEKWVIGRI